MRKINEIAGEIKKDWKKVHYTAAPYLFAMGQVEKMEDKFIQSNGKNLILRFLNNAGTWKGETARRIKAELREMVK